MSVRSVTERPEERADAQAKAADAIARLVHGVRVVRRLVRRVERRKCRQDVQQKQLVCTNIAYAPRKVLPASVVGHEYLRLESALNAMF